MLVFWPEKLVYLATPKTGSTALEGALAPHASMVLRAPPEIKHAPVNRYRRFLQPMFTQISGKPTLETIAVVRNPIDWLGSWYKFRQRDAVKGKPHATHGMSFDDFVLEYTKGRPAPCANVGSQAKFLTLGDKSLGVTHLYRYEAMDQVCAFFAARLGLATMRLKRKNTSPDIPLALSQDVEARLRARRAAEFDIWQLGRS